LCGRKGQPRSSPRWRSRAAELLNALPETAAADDDPDTPQPAAVSPYVPNVDPEEAYLETKELSKYLLAKSFFDCREYDRCAAVFLPDALLSSVLISKAESPATATSKAKGKGRASDATRSSTPANVPRLSQKSLFLALYAKVLSGEKRKDEDAEMVMGPQDLGTVTNKQLLVVGKYLAAWFESRTTEDEEAVGSQGWLEYLCEPVLHFPALWSPRK
jgi:anaphase-promoting complex subunit 8